MITDAARQPHDLGLAVVSKEGGEGSSPFCPQTRLRAASDPTLGRP